MLKKVRILTNGGFKVMFDHVKLPIEVIAQVESNDAGLSMASVTTRELHGKGVAFCEEQLDYPHYRWHFFIGSEAEVIE